MSVMRYARGRSTQDNHPQVREAPDFRTFAREVLGDRSPQKGLTYICAPFNGDGRRCAEGALQRAWLPVDLDHLTADQRPDVQLWFTKFRFFGYETASSTAEAPRLRIIIELSRPVSRVEGMRIGAAISRDLRDEFGIPADDSVYRAEQPVFTPVGDVRPFFGTADSPLDVDLWLAAAPDVTVVPTITDTTDDQLRNTVLTGAAGVHNALASLAARLVGRGMAPTDAEAALTGLLEQAAWRQVEGERWDQRRRDIPRIVSSAARKFADRRAEQEAAPVPRGARAAADWPAPLGAAALHGLVGDLLRLLEPATEADAAALLVQLLALFGIHAGRSAHYLVEGTPHCANLYCALVGDTAKARKGTSWGRILQLHTQVVGKEPPYLISGLSSGEGLKFKVRDATERKQTDKETGDVRVVVTDAGVSDKRLLAVEPEFSSVLRGMQRQHSTLSATIREAWDSGDLSTVTKHDPITATGAHVGIVAHITVQELQAELGGTDIANGFANRFLFACARRSKLLPFGGMVDSQVFDEVVRRFAAAAETARGRGRLDFTAAAREMWAERYAALSEARPGLYGALTARAEAQCIRLALVYALMDQAAEIDTAHLSAAYEVWRYCADSALYIFGDAIGDRIADEILRALRAVGEEGLTRTEISGLFARNATTDRISHALALLLERGLARRGVRPTRGRPTEVWVAVTKETK